MFGRNLDTLARIFSFMILGLLMLSVSLIYACVYEKLQPVFSCASVDRAAYFRNTARRRRETNLEPRLLWLLATAANQASDSEWDLQSSSGSAEKQTDARLHIHTKPKRLENRRKNLKVNIQDNN